jgi:hypothetical protein
VPLSGWRDKLLEAGEPGHTVKSADSMPAGKIAG